MVDRAGGNRPRMGGRQTRIGVTAGASAPEVLVQEVIARLKELGAAGVKEAGVQPSTSCFRCRRDHTAPDPRAPTDRLPPTAAPVQAAGGHAVGARSADRRENRESSKPGPCSTSFSRNRESPSRSRRRSVHALFDLERSGRARSICGGRAPPGPGAPTVLGQHDDRREAPFRQRPSAAAAAALGAVRQKLEQPNSSTPRL